MFRALPGSDHAHDGGIQGGAKSTRILQSKHTLYNEKPADVLAHGGLDVTESLQTLLVQSVTQYIVQQVVSGTLDGLRVADIGCLQCESGGLQARWCVGDDFEQLLHEDFAILV